MRRHLADERVLDLAEGAGSTEERAHVEGCAACASRVEATRGGMALARRAEVPEPSPLYWEAMRQSVGRRIGEEPRRAARWPWLLPLLAAGALVAVLWSGPAPGPGPSPGPGLPAWTALPDADEDPSLTVLEAVLEASGDDIDEASPVRAQVAALTDEESRALVDALRGNRNGGES
jgi:hypothetical protein